MLGIQKKKIRTTLVSVISFILILTNVHKQTRTDNASNDSFCSFYKSMPKVLIDFIIMLLLINLM